MRNAIALVLGGGRGSRLYPLTKFRSKPAAPLGAKYRLIDIPLSNCINSDLRRIYVLTQFMSVSLHRHIRQTYNFDHFSGGVVELLAAQQTVSAGTDWYEGTADAVRKNMDVIRQPNVEHVLILSGDQLYRMDYRDMLKTHVDSGADATIASIPVSREDAKSLGIMRLDDTGRVQGFLEKPQTNEEMDTVSMPPDWIDSHGIQSKGRDCLASMGIYLFNRDTLVDMLTKTTYSDFGREIFPASIRARKVQTHLFDGYWEDIGTIKAFFDCNLSLAQENPLFQLASAEAPVYSRPRFLPPSRIGDATVKGSLVADGCHIGDNVVIENSVIGLRCNVADGAVIRNSFIMGADDYETETEKQSCSSERPPIGIGENAHIEGAIVDKNCRIGKGVKVISDGSLPDTDESLDCVVRDGVPVLVKNAIFPDGWVLPTE
jgi:glucose-1-phosphate adenylyltransferase